MEQPTQDIKHTSNPLVRLIVADALCLTQDYENTEITLNPSCDNAPSFFNEVLEDIDADAIYCFVPPFDRPRSESTISKMVQRIIDYPLVNAVYADTIIHRDGQEYRQWLPAFYPRLLMGHVVINTPLMITGKALSRGQALFNPLLERLYPNTFFIDVCQRVVSLHVAEALWDTFVDSDVDITNDLKVLQECQEPPAT